MGFWFFLCLLLIAKIRSLAWGLRWISQLRSARLPTPMLTSQTWVPPLVACASKWYPFEGYSEKLLADAGSDCWPTGWRYSARWLNHGIWCVFFLETLWSTPNCPILPRSARAVCAAVVELWCCECWPRCLFPRQCLLYSMITMCIPVP